MYIHVRMFGAVCILYGVQLVTADGDLCKLRQRGRRIYTYLIIIMKTAAVDFLFS